MLDLLIQANLLSRFLGNSAVAHKLAGVEITLDGMADHLKYLGVLTSYDVLVGVPADNTMRLSDADLKAVRKAARKAKLTSQQTRDVLYRVANQKHGGPTNALIAYTQENGNERLHIPPRPFLVPTVAAMRQEAVKILAQAGEFFLQGKREKALQVLHTLGLRAQARVRAAITAGAGWPPLSQTTLAARRRRGRTGTKPLIDTGQLRNAQTYVVRRRSYIPYRTKPLPPTPSVMK